MKYFIFVLLFVLNVSSSVAEERNNLLIKIGEWGIFREIDQMTDKAECAAVYYDTENEKFSQPILKLNYDKSSYAIFFIINYRIDSYRIRFDDSEVAETVNIIPILGRRGIAQIFGENYDKALSSNRIRVEVSGYINKEFFDVNTSRAMEVIQYMTTHEKCN